MTVRESQIERLSSWKEKVEWKEDADVELVRPRSFLLLDFSDLNSFGRAVVGRTVHITVYPSLQKKQLQKSGSLIPSCLRDRPSPPFVSVV